MSQSSPPGGWPEQNAPTSGGWPQQDATPTAASWPQQDAPAASSWSDPTQPTVTPASSPGHQPASSTARYPVYPGSAYGTPAAAPPGYGYPQYGYAAAPKTNGLAVASMVISIISAVGLCFYGLGGLLGVLGAILGHVSRRQIRERTENGDGMAMAGVIVGWIAFGLGILVAAFFAVIIVTAIGAGAL